MAKQRLLVLASTYPRWHGDHEPGFVHGLNRRLVDEFEIHVVTPHAPGASVFEVIDDVAIYRFRYAPEILETLVHGGGILSNLKRNLWKWFLVPSFFCGMIFQSFRCIRRVNPDVIHAHWIIPQGFSLAVLGLFLKEMPPVILTSHGGDLFGLRGALFSKIKSWVISKVGAISVVSQPMVKEALLLGANPGRIAVIPMGVDFSGQFPLGDSLIRTPGQMLFVGRLVHSKGVEYLIKALPNIKAEVKSAHLLVVGDGPERPVLESLVIRLGLQESVKFLGSLRQDQLPSLYRQASVFVAPFVGNEGLGLVTIEAIACGCPVVVGDIPVIGSIFLNSEIDMRVRPGDVADLTRKVTDVLVSPERAIQRTIVVCDRFAGQFSWEVVQARYCFFIKNAISSKEN